MSRKQMKGLRLLRVLSPTVAFALVTFSLGELGDGLNIFQGIYLVGIGWNEGSVGTALSLMGLTSLLVQTFAGDWIDKTTVDRRNFLVIASIFTALSALMIMFVREGNQDHMLIFISKIIEGVASSFIGPCIAAITLATFGPDHFDRVMASNIFWGHIGSVVAAVLAGLLAYFLYPDIKYSFLVIGFSALVAIVFIPFLPEGDPNMGRGFSGKAMVDPDGNEITQNDDMDEKKVSPTGANGHPEATEYSIVFSDRKTLVICATGFFFHFANANVLLVLGELMGGDNDDGSPKQTAIPLIAAAIVLAQVTMSVATVLSGRLTDMGVGRKILFMVALLSLPLRCALIIWWKDAGEAYLLSTQILDGVGGGIFGLLHPYLVADITFGTGRFNVVMGLSASCFGIGATLSNFLGMFGWIAPLYVAPLDVAVCSLQLYIFLSYTIGQNIVESFGHVASLSGSLIVSIIPIIVFGLFMPETHGRRGELASNTTEKDNHIDTDYVKV